MSNISNKFTGIIDIIEPPVKTITLYPTKDAPLLQGEYYVNYGEAGLMQCTNSPASMAATIMNFAGLQSIDSKVWENLTGIELHLETSGYRKDDHTINVSAYNNDNWEEEFVSWGNAPKKGNKLFEFTVKADTDVYDLDVQTLVKQRKLNKYDNIGFYFNSFDAADKRIVSINSKESRRKPYLRIKYYDIPGAPYAKNFPGQLDVQALVFNDKNPYERGGRTQGQISGVVEIKTIHVYKDIIGELKVPEFVAVHEIFKDSNGKVLGENAKPGEAPTPIEKQYIPTDDDWENLVDYADWDVEINGEVTSAKKAPAAVINGTVTPWFGSAFEMTFLDTSMVQVYSGVERSNILANLAAFKANTKIFGKIESQGDLINGLVDIQGVQEKYIYGDITVCIPVPDKDIPGISGKVTMAVPVFDVIVDEDESSVSDGDLIDCPGIIVYKKDDDGNDTNEIDEENSIYLKVDGRVGADGEYQIEGKITVPKYFTTETKYFTNVEDTTPVFVEKIDVDALDPENVFDPIQNPVKRTDGSVEITCPVADIRFTKNQDGTDDIYRVDETTTGDYTYIIGKVVKEIGGKIVIVNPIDPKDLPEIEGTIDAAVKVFVETKNDDGTTESTGDLITGTFDFQGVQRAEIIGKISAAVPHTVDTGVPEIIGEVFVAVPLDADSIPEITCDSANVVYIKNDDGTDSPVVDEEKSGEYLLVWGLVHPATEDPSTHEIVCGGDLLTGKVRISHKSAFTWTFTETDGTEHKVNSTDEIENWYNDTVDNPDKYTTIDSEGDLITGEVTVMGVVHKYTTDEHGNVDHEGDLLVCHSDNVVYKKDQFGKNTIEIDDALSGDYFRVMAICGAINAYDENGKRIKDFDMLEDDPRIDYVSFDKPNQEIVGDGYVAAKVTAWLDGTLNTVSEQFSDVTGEVKVQGGVFGEVRGVIKVEGGSDTNLSYGFII